MKAIQRVLIVVLLGLAGSPAWCQSLRIQGPSAGQTLTAAAMAEYQREKAGTLTASFGVSGTGAALQKLCRNEIDAVAATRPIVARELERCQFAGVAFIEVPIAFDALVVIVNSRNTHVTSLTLDMLRTLWSEASQDKLARWDQLDAKWPALPIKLYGPVAQSQGASYFNEAVLGAVQARRRDYTASVDEVLLMRAVARDLGALSYVSLSSYLGFRGQLKAVPIVEGAGPAVLPSVQAVLEGRYQTLARPLFLYLRVKALEEPAVKEFTDYWMVNGARIAGQAGLVPLSAATYSAGVERMRKLAQGSVWEGKITVRATLQEVERRHSAM